MIFQVSETLLNTNAEIIAGNIEEIQQEENPPIVPILKTNEAKVTKYIKDKIEQILNDEEGYGHIEFWMSTHYDETKLEEPADELFSAKEVVTSLLLDNPEFSIIILTDVLHPELQGRTRKRKYKITWNSQGIIYKLSSLVKIFA